MKKLVIVPVLLFIVSCTLGGVTDKDRDKKIESLKGNPVQGGLCGVEQVCAADGKTYENDCAAAAADNDSWESGVCEEMQ